MAEDLRGCHSQYASSLSADASTVSESALQKAWFRRALSVLHEPRAVYAAMREESPKAVEARQEPIVALVFLAGIAAVLAFSSTSRELLDDPGIDGALVPVLAFLGGGIYGFAGYWVGGLALYLGIRGAKGEGSFVQARHVLAYALAPMALALAVWPVRLAVYGGDSFRSGGADEGLGHWVFTGISLGFFLWSLALLHLGIRVVHGFTPIRALGALVLTALALLGLGVLFVVGSA